MDAKSTFMTIFFNDVLFGVFCRDRSLFKQEAKLEKEGVGMVGKGS